MADNLLDSVRVDDLRARLGGPVVTPTMPDYEDVRAVFNSMITARPSVIARCGSVSDVRTALEFARGNGLEVAVRSGGHSVAGSSLIEAGLVIDVRPMADVAVDPAQRTVRLGGGATWAAVDRESQRYGLATTGGRVSTTGVAGLALGGGSGWLERKFGLTCDNLLAVELVTADGHEVSANEYENPELFWALHGGGGNFGVATSLLLRLHPLERFSMALLLWPAEAGRAVAGSYREFIAGAPDEIGGGLIYLTGPSEEFVPRALTDVLCCAVLVTFTGPEPELREHIAPLLAAEPPGRLITDIPYAELQCMLDDPPGYRNYWSDEHLVTLSDEALDRFCERARDMIVPSPSQQVLLPWGGAVAGGADWPGFHRDATWAVHPLGLWEDPADDGMARAWVRDLRADMRPWASGDVYLNFIGDEGADRVRAGYGERNYRRLARVKARFDPTNVFNRWHNVLPETEGEPLAGAR